MEFRTIRLPRTRQFVEQSDVSVRQPRQARVFARPAVDQPGDRPRAAFVGAQSQRQIAAATRQESTQTLEKITGLVVAGLVVVFSIFFIFGKR